MAALHVIPDWTVPYLAYMNRGELPEDETLARQIIRQSKSMTICQWRITSLQCDTGVSTLGSS